MQDFTFITLIMQNRIINVILHKVYNLLKINYIITIRNIFFGSSLNNQSPLGMIFAYKLIKYN